MKENKSKIGFSFAWQGLRQVICEEKNLQIHLITAFFVVLMSIYFRLNLIEWAIIILVICFVIVAEIVNSIFERLIDYFKPGIHPKAKQIKDMAASVVLVTVIFACIIGCIIFLPKLLIYINE